MADAAAEYTYFWVKLDAAMFGPLRHVVGTSLDCSTRCCLPLATKRLKRVDVSDGEFVKRPAIERKLSAALKTSPPETVLLYGPRGSGKTSMIHYALGGRRGVFSIRITKDTHNDVCDEFIEKISRRLHLFGIQQDQYFVEDVFSASPRPPIVVVTLDTRCTGEVLDAVVVMCKILSYEMSFQMTRTARFVVDLSSSRAAIDASLRLDDLRCVGVHVGYFSDTEALLYATQRAPESFKNPKRREKIAESVVDCFDGRVLTLQTICRALQRGPPGDLDFIETTIKEEQQRLETLASGGWITFCDLLATKIGIVLDKDARELEEAVKLLLTGPQPDYKIISLLPGKKAVTPRDIGRFNADTGYHPLAIDPFDSTLSLSGKPIEAVLRKKYAEAIGSESRQC